VSEITLFGEDTLSRLDMTACSSSSHSDSPDT
jgi:hypothetical protein